MGHGGSHWKIRASLVDSVAPDSAARVRSPISSRSRCAIAA
jgi:hypothetical protein